MMSSQTGTHTLYFDSEVSDVQKITDVRQKESESSHTYTPTHTHTHPPPSHSTHPSTWLSSCIARISISPLSLPIGGLSLRPPVCTS